VKRFEAAMDKPDYGNVRQSKSVFRTGFYGYAVLDYAAMSKKVEEQVRGLEASMQQLQSDYSQCQAKLHATEADLAAAAQRERTAAMTVQTQAEDLVRLQHELGSAQVCSHLAPCFRQHCSAALEACPRVG
jgi:chromosome segregation ATPase